MDAVTYPDDKVGSFMKDRVIPVRVAYNHKPLADDFNVKWTPTLSHSILTDLEHHRTVGFLAPEELIGSLMLGIGKSNFEREEFDKAIATFNLLLERHPKSDSTPEAVFLRGVSMLPRAPMIPNRFEHRMTSLQRSTPTASGPNGRIRTGSSTDARM